MTHPCEQADPELWFSKQPAEIAMARDLCGPCPARADCLVGAIERQEPWGVWGGEQIQMGVIVSAPQITCRRKGCEQVVEQPKTGRRKVFCSRDCKYLDSHGPKEIKHGTAGGYRTHRRRGEAACASCLEASARAHRLAEAARRARRQGRAA